MKKLLGILLLCLAGTAYGLTYDSGGGSGGSGSVDQTANYSWTGTHSWTQPLSLTGSGGGAFSTTGSSIILGVNGSSWTFTTTGITAPNGYIVSEATKTWIIPISSGTGWNSLSIPVFTAPDDSGITITKITAESMPASSTVTYQLDERAYGSINTTGSSIFSVTYSSAPNTGLTTTSFSDSSIAAGSHLVFTTPSSGASAGAPANIIITISGKRQN